MRELNSVNVVGCTAGLLSDSKNLFLRDIDKFCVGIDETPDQPGTGDPINLRVFSRDPFAGTRPDVAAGWHSLLGPAFNTAFQEICLDSHKAQCSGDSLADFMSVKAICDHRAPARQIISPPFHVI